MQSSYRVSESGRTSKASLLVAAKWSNEIQWPAIFQVESCLSRTEREKQDVSEEQAIQSRNGAPTETAHWCSLRAVDTKLERLTAKFDLPRADKFPGFGPKSEFD